MFFYIDFFEFLFGTDDNVQGKIKFSFKYKKLTANKWKIGKFIGMT